VASGVLEAMQLKGLETSATVKLLFGKVDREIKRLADNGEASFRIDPPRELTKNLLYYVAHARSGGERVKDIKHTYRLDDLVPTEAELEQAKGTLAGKNRALLDTVSSAIKEDLLRVKDQLDLFLRNADAKPEDLASQTDVLDRVADTLGMLGLGVPRRVVQDQRKALSEIAAGMRKAEEGALLDIAGALLYVEASLDENIETLGGSETPTPTAAAAATAELELPQVEVKRILEAVMKEAQANLQQAKNDVVAFVESPWDHAKVTTIPRLLEEIAGALKMLNLDEAVEQTQALTRFIEVELLRMKRVPSSEQMDRLADALASIEYYVEATRDQRVGREKILDVTRRSLEALGYWPVPSDDELAQRIEAMPAQAPEPAPIVVPDSLTLGFGPPTVSGRKAMQDMPEPTAAEAAAMPSIDLPGMEDIAAYAARVDRREDAPAATPEYASAEGGVMPELRSVVEIGRGSDLSDLMLGETAGHAHAPPPPAADLAGLRFAETQSGLGVDRDDDYEWIEVEEEVELESPADITADATFQSAPSDEIDDEIREVFVEEVHEEINNIGRQLPEWRAQVEDFEKLKPIRRSFHTLKGSGRLVGALALGEFSWKIENMLNRVLDKTIQPSEAVHAILGHAVAALPELLAALRGEGAPKADIAGIMAVADRLSQGEEAFLSRTEKVKVKQVGGCACRGRAWTVRPSRWSSSRRSTSRSRSKSPRKKTRYRSRRWRCRRWRKSWRYRSSRRPPCSKRRPPARRCRRSSRRCARSSRASSKATWSPSPTTSTHPTSRRPRSRRARRCCARCTPCTARSPWSTCRCWAWCSGRSRATSSACAPRRKPRTDVASWRSRRLPSS
jgi:chemosensory pili system protein ChpA (sensor histidine kinase/response regulator)